jgi:hypothetical protein
LLFAHLENHDDDDDDDEVTGRAIAAVRLLLAESDISVCDGRDAAVVLRVLAASVVPRWFAWILVEGVAVTAAGAVAGVVVAVGVEVMEAVAVAVLVTEEMAVATANLRSGASLSMSPMAVPFINVDTLTVGICPDSGLIVTSFLPSLMLPLMALSLGSGSSFSSMPP